MATIRYKCDTCKREIELLENAEGLNNFNSCIITKGCRGRLYKISRNPYSYREAFAEADPTGDVENFSPRRLFFKHEQTILSDKWMIKHNLNSSPVVKVFFASEDETELTPVESDEFDVIVRSSDELEIVLNGSFKGQAHLISRSVSEDSVETVPSLDSLIPISYNGTVAFGVIGKYFDPQTSSTYDTNGNIQLDVILEEPNEEPIFCTETLLGLESGISPWNDFSSILFRRRRHFNIKTKKLLDFKVLEDRYDSLLDIPQLTKLKIRQINFSPASLGFQDMKSKQLFWMLASPPFDKADKILDKIIDIGEVNQHSSNTSFVFIDGVLYSESSNVEAVYPKMEKSL